jgi:hypothetical protein
MVPLRFPGLTEPLFVAAARGLQLLVPAFLALVGTRFTDGHNADETHSRALEAEVARLREAD